ncbi:YgfZ/GcvT domain-containing protein [Candidatus Pelagibacter communis]|uniref:CAF17-like 4Fe-4S cluster assembly/insertion protein YgfZ n=1 Tax=Pelagibacter ubique TaxID=198252 RepID=UPI00094D7094|nr:folate-binding protein YgfZ [Candidatus Pelagibacter ubique]
MKKDQVVILEKRGVILVSGEDSKDFLQNIITNDINKVSNKNSIFSALLTPQGKYLNEFFIIQNVKGYLLDCSENSTGELIKDLSKYKLRSKVEIEDFSTEFVIGVINDSKFKELQGDLKSNENTITYRDTPIFLDPRNNKLGARIISNLEKLYLTIKKLNLSIIDSKEYFSLAHKLGVPEKGLINLKDQLFGLEANFDTLQAIDFKKGCFVGQENTARMKLKNKLRRRLLPISSSEELNIGDEITFNNIKIGKILIDQPYPFGLIKVLEPNLEDFIDKKLLANNKECKILENVK